MDASPRNSRPANGRRKKSPTRPSVVIWTGKPTQTNDDFQSTETGRISGAALFLAGFDFVVRSFEPEFSQRTDHFYFVQPDSRPGGGCGRHDSGAHHRWD